MSLSAKELADNPEFFVKIIDYTRAIVSAYGENQRTSRVFSSQQRWLMALAGFALYYGGVDGKPPGIHANRFADFVVEHEIASHNTALSFVQEMLDHHFLRYQQVTPDRRVRPMEPTEEAVKQLAKWLSLHLAVLDGLDGGKRGSLLTEQPELIAALQPAISVGIIASDAVRHPGETFDLFTWASSGGIIMDHLISHVGAIDPETQRAIVGPIAFTDICRRFRISRTHAKRLMRKAMSMQSVGWTGSSGRSELWLSSGFIQEYRRYQAEKFAIIDAAWRRTLGTRQTRVPKLRLIFTSAAPSG